MEVLESSDYALALSILNRARDLTLASIGPEGAPHATTVTFANDALIMYAAIGIDSEKAHNIRARPRVALTVNAPYRDWREIQGMSIDGNAEIVGDPHEMLRASQLLLNRFPQFAEFMSDTASIPWPGTVFIKIAPVSVTLLDYVRGFGYTGRFRVQN